MDGLKSYLKDFSEILRGQRVGLVNLFLMFVAVSVLDLIGIGLVGGYISLLTRPEVDQTQFALMTNLIESNSIDQQSLVSLLGIVLVGVFLAKALAAILVNRRILLFCNGQVVRLRTLIVKAFQELAYEDFVKKSSAEYIQRSQNYINQANNSLILLLRTASEIVVLIVILAMLVTVNFAALVGLAVVGLAVFILYDRIFRSRLLISGKEANFANESMTESIQESFAGLKEIRILGKEKYFLERVVEGSKVVARVNAFAGTVSLAPRYIIELVVVIFVVVLVLVIFVQSGSVESSLPLIGMFGVAALRLAPAMTMTISHTSILRNQRHAVAIVAADLKQIRKSSCDAMSSKEADAISRFDLLELRKIRFRYDAAVLPALDSVSLQIEAGECVGLIGESGSGKTTLVDLMLGLLIPSDGDIFLNGKPLARSLNAWRSKIAYLPQDVFLLGASIKKNIALGVQDCDIDVVLLERAVQQARLMDLINGLPEGVETEIGERGVRLSGGQRQRIALARAFYHKREILVLDEATSALDDETEREIVKEIQELKGKKTMIVIAHRLTTLRYCDQIYRLDKGRIVERGSYNKVVLRLREPDLKPSTT